MKFTGIFLGILFILTTNAYGAIITEEIDYVSEGIPLKGYLAYDDAIVEQRPGIIVVHEWWGHNAYARKRARMLAELGYTALAVDMYGEGKNTDHPEDAGKFAAQATADMEVFKQRFLAGYNILKKHPTVDGEDIGAIGYCFGGGTVLNMARAGIDLKGVVSFHGSLNPGVQAEKGDVKAKILVCHGGADHFVSDEVLTDFRKEMEDLDVDYQINIYGGAKHSFTNPNADQYTDQLGIAYDPAADQESWQDMRSFFGKIFP